MKASRDLFVAIICLLVLGASNPCEARRWSIRPDGTGDSPTIQAGIDSASVGDTVLVCSGNYLELIDFRGKDIVVLGSGPLTTTIDGMGLDGPCVTIANGEGPGATLSGFTIQNGNGCYNETCGLRIGAGILIIGAEPTVDGNVIRNNQAISGDQSGFGGGIYLSSQTASQPIIVNNTISNNRAGNSGGGIAIFAQAAPFIAWNTIVDNWTLTGDGAGIYALSDQNGIVVTENVIADNQAGDKGAGMLLSLATIGLVRLDVEVSRNQIYRNHAVGGAVYGSGGGMFGNRLSGSIHHNTLVYNRGDGPDSTWGGAMALRLCGSLEVTENVIAFSEGGGGVRCIDETPTFRNNLVWDSTGPHGSLACQDWWQGNGNVVADPYFCDPLAWVFTLAENSPALTHPAGPLGALGMGCGPVATIPTTWGALKRRYTSP